VRYVRAASVAVAAAMPMMLGWPSGSLRSSLLSQEVQPTSANSYEFSGLKVIHSERRDSDIVAVRLYLLGGTRQVTEEAAGVEALLVETMALEASEVFRSTGSRTTHEATPDWTVTGFVALKSDFGSAWSGFASSLVEPQLSEDAIQSAHRILAARIRRERTRPEARLASGARRSAFREHPYRINPLGTLSSLVALTRADLQRYFDEQFVTSRMLLVVVGAISAAEVESLIAESLGRLPAGHYRWTLPPELPDQKARWVVEHQQLPTSYIIGYFDGPSPTHADYFPFLVSVAYLSGRIGYRVRQEEALSSAAYASVLDYARPIGVIHVSSANPGEAMTQIRDALSEASEYPVMMNVPTPHTPQWRRYLEQLALRELFEWSSSDGKAAALARSYLFFGRLPTPEEYGRNLLRVDSPSIARMVRRYMRGIQWAFMGDTALMRGRW